MKRCSPSLVKTIVRDHFTPTTIALTEKMNNDKYWWGWVLEPPYTAGGNLKETATWENSLSVPQNTRYRATIWLSNSTHKYIPKEIENLHLPQIHMIYLYSGVLFSHKKEWNIDICYHMDESWIPNAKWKKPNTKRCLLYDCIYIWNIQTRHK